MQLQEWFNDNMPDEDFIYGNAMKDQVVWIRDKLAYMIWNTKPFDKVTIDGMQQTMIVSSTHTSKSVLLPVYEFVFEGVSVRLRGNFHDWCIRCNKPLTKEFPNWMSKKHHIGSFEGMHEDGSPIKICVSDKEQAYAAIWWMLEEGIEKT